MGPYYLPWQPMWRLPLVHTPARRCWHFPSFALSITHLHVVSAPVCMRAVQVLREPAEVQRERAAEAQAANAARRKESLQKSEEKSKMKVRRERKRVGGVWGGGAHACDAVAGLGMMCWACLSVQQCSRRGL